MRYPVILADPPWSFRNGGTRAAPNYLGSARPHRHYRVVGFDELNAIAAPMISACAEPDAFLFLWAPNALVLDRSALTFARHCGFVPKQLIPWVKLTKDGERPALGMGNYTRVCTEQLILCRRGRAIVKARDIPGVIMAARGRHSAKPDEQYALIESLVDGPYLELYARRRRPGWTAWGDQLGEEHAENIRTA